MIRHIIFYMMGGLGLFLFGMRLMSDGLRAAAGQKLRKILESITKKALVAFLIGIGVTAIIQSSSATTVMVIGLVNAGLLTLKQAIPVIIGSNVGTTMTAWLVSISGLGVLDITTYAMPGVGLGFLMYIGGRTRRTKSIGQMILGLSVLFLGIGFMKNAFEPLQQSPKVPELFVALGSNVLLGILAGTVVTMLIQSSSASIAIVQILAIEGAFGSNWNVALNVAIPFILGCNIGTTITAQLAALQTNVNAKRAAWAHTIFNVFGTLIAYPFVRLGWFTALVQIVSPWELGPTTIASSIAVAHTVFNVVNSFIFLPMATLLARITTFLVHEKPGEAEVRPMVLEKHLLDTPEIALEQTKREIVRMARTAKRAVIYSVDGIIKDDIRQLQQVREIEDFVDTFQLSITSYLTALSSRRLSDEVSIELPVLLHTVNDLERVGDHAVNIVEIAERKIEQKLTFSEFALSEADQLKKQVDQMLDRIIAALENNDTEAAKLALGNENNLNKMQIEFRRSHVQRMTEGICLPETGLIFIDLVDNVEKIGDHLNNIAQAVLGGLQWVGVKPRITAVTEE